MPVTGLAHLSRTYRHSTHISCYDFAGVEEEQIGVQLMFSVVSDDSYFLFFWHTASTFRNWISSRDL
jgi:hypothetical protein